MLNCFFGGLGYVFGPMLGTLVLYFGWDLLFQTGKFQLLIYSTLDDCPDAVPAERTAKPWRPDAEAGGKQWLTFSTSRASPSVSAVSSL